MNSNVTAAIIKNFDTAERVLEETANSSGSALAENEKYLDSINGKIAQFQASWQSLSATMISSDMFKGVVEGATTFVNVIDAIADKIGAIPTLIGAITTGLAAYRLSQGQRTGILDFVTGEDGRRSVRLFNNDLVQMRDTIKDVYQENYNALGGGGRFNKARAGFRTAGDFFGAAILGNSSQIREHTQLINQFNKARETASRYKGHDASGTLSREGQVAAKNLENARQALAAYDTTMQASQSHWANYVKQVGVTNASFKGFVANLRETRQLGAAVANQFKSFGLNLASTFGSAFLTAGISMAVSAVISGISKLITYEEDLRKKTAENAASYEDTRTSIQGYASEIDQLQTSLNSGNLSVEDAISARQRLAQIQGELQSSYGAEADGLNLITMSATETTEALNRLAEAQANSFLVENRKGLEQAEEEMSRSRQFSRSFELPDSEDLRNQIKSLADEFESIDIFTGSGASTSPRITFEIDADVNTAIDELTQFRNKAQSLGIDLNEIVSANTFGATQTLGDYITETLGKYQEIQAKYGQADLEGINATITASKNYRDIQDQITQAQSDYNKALYDSYDTDEARREAISKSLNDIRKLGDVIDNAEFTPGDERVREYLKDLYGSLEESIASEELKLDVELDVDEGDTSEKLKGIKDVLSRFSDDNGEVTVKAVLDAKDGDPAAWSALSNAAAEYGMTVEQILPILAQAGMVIDSTGELAYNAASRFSELSSSTTAIMGQQTALSSAIQEQASNGTITLDTYNSLIATSKDFASTLEYEAGAMKINGEAAQKLVEAKTKEQVAEMQLAKSQALERYKQNEVAIESLIQKQEMLQKAGLDLGEAQQANLTRWQSENESIMDTVNKYNILIAQLQRATGAYSQWQNAKQTENSDSIYKNLVTAKKDIDEALKSGQTGKGNDDYTMAIKLLVPDGEDVKAYRDNVLNRYLKLDDSGGLKWEGLGNFLNDAVSKELMKVESDGAYKVAANKVLQDFIDEMKITPEVAKSIFDALEMYDFDFDFSDEEFLDAQNVDLAKQRVQEYNDELNKLQSEYEEIQNNKDLTPEARTEQLDAVLQKIDDANAKEIIAEVQVDAPTLTDAEAALAGISQKQEELKSAETNIGVNSDEAKQAREDLESLQSYINNLDDTTIEITVADINAKINESLKTMGDYKVGSAPFEAAKADLQSYLNMLDQLPDEVKTKYGIDAEYEAKLQQILDGKVSAKDITVKVKADTTEVEQAKETVANAINTAMTVMKSGSLGSQTFDIDGNTDAAKAKIKALESQVVRIKIDGDPGPAKEKIASIQATTPVTVTVTADPSTAQAQINSLQANPVMVNVSANTAIAQMEIAALSARLNATSHTVTVNYDPNTSSLPTRFSSLSRTVNYVANTRGLPSRLSPITRTVNYVSTGADHVNGTAHANGTANQSGGAMAGGNWGAKTGGMTLVGELGREIVVDPRSGQWYTVGDFGAEFVNIPKGSIVFNHKQTEALLEKGYVLGRASALVSGTAMVTGGGRAPSTSSSSSSTKKKKKKTTNTSDSRSQKPRTRTTTTTTATANLDVEVNVNLNDKQLEEKLKDTISKMSEEFDYLINQYEHQIFLKEKKNADYTEIVAIYQKMMDEVHSQAEKYRAKGLTDNSKTIAELQEKWYDYRESQRKAIADYYEDLQKRAENRIKIYSSQFDYSRERDDLKGMQAQADLIVLYNEKLKKIAHDTAEYYRSIGLRDSDDEIAEMKQIWLDADDAIRKVKQDIVDYLIEIVDRASSAVDDLKSAFKSFETAAEEYAQTGGFITLDTFQELMTMGPQYMQLLKDENGLLVINRENVEKLMAARVRDLAAQAMLSYAQRIYNAAQKGAVEELNDLIYATGEATNATFGLAYATLAAAKISKKDYEAALFNMNAMYSAYTNTVEGLSVTMGSEAEKMADSMNNLIEYVMDMLEDRINEQIDHLNEMVDNYKEVVDLKKESLQVTKEENEYQKSLKNKLREIAKIQERLNALALDDSREAQAERKRLLEDLADAQEDIETTQADKAYDVQTEALDKQYEAYKKEKDQEIELLEKSISSYQKKWDMA